MARAQTPKGTGIIVVLVIVIAAGLGAGAFRSFQISGDLHTRLTAVETQMSPRDPYDWMSAPSQERAASLAEVNRLESEIYNAERATDQWTSALVGFVLLIIALSAIVAVVSMISAAIEEAERRLAERRLRDPESLLSKMKNAASEVGKALPRQPTIGGGRHSTADELRKWTALRDEGLISDEEFSKMRQKLLG